jgi:hypothetical protein
MKETNRRPLGSCGSHAIITTSAVTNNTSTVQVERLMSRCPLDALLSTASRQAPAFMRRHFRGSVSLALAGRRCSVSVPHHGPIGRINEPLPPPIPELLENSDKNSLTNFTTKFT